MYRELQIKVCDTTFWPWQFSISLHQIIYRTNPPKHRISLALYSLCIPGLHASNTQPIT